MTIDLLVIHVCSCYMSSKGVLSSHWNTLQLLVFSHIYILFPSSVVSSLKAGIKIYAFVYKSRLQEFPTHGNHSVNS